MTDYARLLAILNPAAAAGKGARLLAKKREAGP